jgi:hypothetical protein
MHSKRVGFRDGLPVAVFCQGLRVLTHESTCSSDVRRDYLSRVAYVFAIYKLGDTSVSITGMYIKGYTISQRQSWSISSALRLLPA